MDMEGSKTATPPRVALTSPPKSAVIRDCSPKSNTHPATVLATPMKTTSGTLQKTVAAIAKSASLAQNSKKQDNANKKPDCSYNCLIGMTLLASGSLPVCEIYRYIEQEFPYFKNSAPEGWKNSVRHSLSLGQFFRKAGNNPPLEKQKGFHWEIIPDKKETLQREVQQFLVYNGRSLSRHQTALSLQLKSSKPEENTRSTPRKRSEPAPRFTTTPRKTAPPGMQPPPHLPPPAYAPPMNFTPVPQAYPPQAFPPQAFPPQAFPPPAFPPPGGNFFYGLYPPQGMQPAYAAPFAFASGFLPMAAPIPYCNSPRERLLPPNTPVCPFPQPNKPSPHQYNMCGAPIKLMPTGLIPTPPTPAPSEPTKVQDTSGGDCRKQSPQESPQEPPPDSASLDMDVDMLTTEDLQRYLDSTLTNELFGDGKEPAPEPQEDDFGMDIDDLLEALDKAENTIKQAAICHNLEAPQSPKFSHYAEKNRTRSEDWQYMMSTKQGSGKFDPCLHKF